MTNRLKILWIPHTGWHIPQRAHLFCQVLAERHEVHVTDWVADFSKPRDYLSLRYLRNFIYRRNYDQKITVHGIPRFSPALFVPALRKLNTTIYSNYVRKIIKDFRIDAVVGTFVVPPPEVPILIFDCFDDNIAYWRDYRHNVAYASEIEQSEQDYILKSKYIVTVSSVLAEQITLRSQSAQSKIRLIPNGVDTERFRGSGSKNLRTKLGLDDYKIVGFISSFGEFAGLLRLIEAFRIIKDPKVVLLLVGNGPQIEPARRLVNKYRLSNVIFIGQVPFKEVTQYFHLIDVGVIPFDKTPFTDAACPIKLLEYSAAHKVVVSTNLVEIQKMNLPNVMIVDSEPSSWAEGICKALSIAPYQQPELEKYDIRYLTEQFEGLLSVSA